MVSFKRVLSVLSVLALSLSMCTTAFADGQEGGDEESPASTNTFSVTGPNSTTTGSEEQVADDTVIYAYTTATGEYSDKASDYGIQYTVTIPQFVHLTNKDGSDKGGSGTYTQTFNFQVEGDIGYAQTLSVVPVLDSNNQVELTGYGFAFGTSAKCTVGLTSSPTAESGVTFVQSNVYNRQNLLDKVSTNYSASAQLSPGAWQGTMDVDIQLTTADSAFSTSDSVASKLASLSLGNESDNSKTAPPQDESQ
jgi:hypothetical protein